jgi:hypothetical protein
MDLRFLRSLYENPPDDDRGRYVSVYLDTTPSTEKAATELKLRWRSARERLARLGADEETLDAVGEVFSTREHEARGRAVFAAAGDVRRSGQLPAPPIREIAEYEPVPCVLPYLAQMEPRMPHVRVGADRTGGEVIAMSAAGPVSVEEAAAESWPVHKVSTGGWSQKRLQRSAEETWEDNAKATAEAASAAAERVGAEFLIIGGDIRERVMVLDLLPRPLRESSVVVEKELAPDSAAFDDAAREEARRRLAAEDRALLDEFRVRMFGKELTTRRATEGLRGTLDALREGLASDVLLDIRSSAGTAPASAGVSESDFPVPDFTVPDGADRVIAEAVRTEAALHFVPPDADPVADRTAALLRAPLAAV